MRGRVALGRHDHCGSGDERAVVEAHARAVERRRLDTPSETMPARERRGQLSGNCAHPVRRQHGLALCHHPHHEVEHAARGPEIAPEEDAAEPGLQKGRRERGREAERLQQFAGGGGGSNEELLERPGQRHAAGGAAPRPCRARSQGCRATRPPPGLGVGRDRRGDATRHRPEPRHPARRGADPGQGSRAPRGTRGRPSATPEIRGPAGSRRPVSPHAAADVIACLEEERPLRPGRVAELRRARRVHRRR